VRAALRGQQSDFAADAAASADDQGDAAAELLFRRLAADLGFFHGPVLDAEGFDGGKRDVVGEDFEAGRVVALGPHCGSVPVTSPSASRLAPSIT
jgi:hypothetical protein